MKEYNKIVNSLTKTITKLHKLIEARKKDIKGVDTKIVELVDKGASARIEIQAAERLAKKLQRFLEVENAE